MSAHLATLERSPVVISSRRWLKVMAFAAGFAAAIGARLLLAVALK
jgi:hypothetical protein